MVQEAAKRAGHCASDSEFRKSALVVLVSAACLAHVNGQPTCCFEVASVIGIVSTEFLEMMEARNSPSSAKICGARQWNRVRFKILKSGG
jgi:hypothetical protein